MVWMTLTYLHLTNGLAKKSVDAGPEALRFMFPAWKWGSSGQDRLFQTWLDSSAVGGKLVAAKA